ADSSRWRGESITCWVRQAWGWDVGGSGVGDVMGEWIIRAGAALSDVAAGDREWVSVAVVAELIEAGALEHLTLPTAWTLDPERVPENVSAKLAARRAAGLPNPLHAHGASSIAAYTGGEKDLRPWVRRTLPAGRSPLDDGGDLNTRQTGALRELLPFDGPDPVVHPARAALDRICAAFEVGWNRSGRTVSGVLLATVAAIFGVFFYAGAAAGVALLAVCAALVGVAEYRRAHSRELTAQDYRALESATVPASHPTPRTRECALAQIAVAAADSIRDSPVWASDILVTHRTRFDPAGEATQITAHAARISTIRDHLGPEAAGDTATALRAREHRGAAERTFARVEHRLLERVAALYRYAAALHTLDTE
ncbi:hypothetical protein, partial [Rhodococcus jostii]|uniref:hypothetical protein n=1 Tax=Rhodococcus jostii TaxID=132919 RepID=UPI00362E7E50